MSMVEEEIQRKLSYSAAVPVSKPSDKVQIYVRLRPTNEVADTFQVISETCLVANPPRTSRVTENVSSFHFSQVFQGKTTQKELFDRTTSSIIQEAYDGKNGLVFAYGVTNSGKTYTILGNNEQPGILPQTFATLFKNAEKYRITASYLEIYNEKVFDLLATGPRRAFLQLLEKEGRVHVKDLEERSIQSFDEAKSLLEAGQRNRQVGETKCNSDSSRSHCVFSLQLYELDKPQVPYSKISIVDLAGCERGAKTGASGIRLQEASKINGSLMNLNRCLETLRYNQLHPKSERPVPFRSSKLTRLFQESLTGMSKQAGRIIMIVAVNPITVEFDETLRTLQYSAIAKEVVTAPSRVVSRRRSVMKTEYTTDGHIKRKRPLTKEPMPASNKLEASLSNDRTSIRGRPSIPKAVSMMRDRFLNESDKQRERPHKPPVIGPISKKRITEEEVSALRDEIEKLKEELQIKDEYYLQHEIKVRRELVAELNKQLDGTKASYEAKLNDIHIELTKALEANETLERGKSQLENLCEKLQEQIDECEDEIRRIEARHKQELEDLQTF